MYIWKDDEYGSLNIYSIDDKKKTFIPFFWFNIYSIFKLSWRKTHVQTYKLSLYILNLNIIIGNNQRLARDEIINFVIS